MSTTRFVPFWSEGADSFLSDPPNADLSIVEGATLRQTVVVLRDPVLDGDDLHYTVQIVDGDMPVLGEEVSSVHRCHRDAIDAGFLRGSGAAGIQAGGHLLTGRDRGFFVWDFLKHGKGSTHASTAGRSPTRWHPSIRPRGQSRALGKGIVEQSEKPDRSATLGISPALRTHFDLKIRPV